ncbi:hypothetical protein [Mesorhizobium sp.]|uniref:hypothetical protein n=1 Tax=Mesorhizobium sp. TaxID=1871066 RepID=UPI000FE651D3|nr:hypothetical protein [Mesorhizobium sp.]RWF32418.1 MAG: hypothetical protein EOS45_06785 [Mesorhizobium sp.]
MATKRIPLRRRQGSNAEYQAWRETFETGRDGFGDLPEFGIFDPIPYLIPAEELPAAQATFQEQKRDAWKRFGARFLAERAATDARKGEPKAFLEFGAP